MLLHAQIESNKRKTWLIAVVFLLLFTGVGMGIGIIMFDNPLAGVILALVFGALYMAIMLTAGTKMVMAMNGAREVTSEEEYPFLWNTVEALCIGARLPMPKVYIIDSSTPNAFAAGMSPKNAAVAVTKGLLDRLNREEIEAVLAHEVAHIRNYDVRIATVAIALVAVIGLLSDIAVRSMWWGGRSRSSRQNRNDTHPALVIITMILVVLGPIIAVLVQLALSRNREYLADASGAELCRNPMALASALKKISSVDEPLPQASATCAALYFSDPMKANARRSHSRPTPRNLLSTHPPVEERIKRLEQMM